MRDDKARVTAALKSIVVPGLRARGFEGSFPKFRRKVDKCTHVVWFTVESGAHAQVQAGLNAIARRDDTSVAQDYKRAIGVRNQTDVRLTDLASKRDHASFWYEDAEARWGEDWPEELATMIDRLLETKAEAWWKRR